jgi:hypothetical protein
LEVEEDVEDYDDVKKEGKKNNSVWYLYGCLNLGFFFFTNVLVKADGMQESVSKSGQ